MKILHQDIFEYDGDKDGSITIELNGYIYRIGQLDGDCCYVERQSVEDDFNQNDGYEYPNWVPTDKSVTDFKFLNKLK